MINDSFSKFTFMIFYFWGKAADFTNFVFWHEFVKFCWVSENPAKSFQIVAKADWNEFLDKREPICMEVIVSDDIFFLRS